MSGYSTDIILNASMPCGSALLRQALRSQKFSRTTAYYTGYPAPSLSATTTTVNPDFSVWLDLMPMGDVVYSALGLPTTSDDVPTSQGGKSDFEWNYDFAKAAKNLGAKVYVMIVPYEMRKHCCLGLRQNQRQTVAQVEKSITDLGYETFIILEPGPLMDAIPNAEPFGGLKRLVDEVPLVLYRTPFQALAGYPISSDEIAKAAVSLSFRLKSGVYRVSAAELLKEASK